MATQDKAPETLLEAVQYFADPDLALDFVANLRWPEAEQACPRCGSVREHTFLKTRRIWKCRDCKKQFSVKVGTIFEDSPISLSKWLPAMWMLANCKNGISSYELARALGVTQKTAWFMLHRIRNAMEDGTDGPLSGEVEVDETYIGGKAINMHESKKKRVIKSTGGGDETAVMGLLERPINAPHSMVRTRLLTDASRRTIQGHVKANVEAGSSLYTDRHASYCGLRDEYLHEVVDHIHEYVRGRVHTNGIENFWSLLKRTLAGTYVSVDPFHIIRYLDEQTFRFNNREDTDRGRFVKLASSIIDKHLSYDELTGKDLRPA